MPKIQYETNVFDILNRSGRSLEARRAIRQQMRSQFFIRFAIKAIDFMVKRTKDGLDVFGNPFEGYSQSYKKSLAYRIYNKTGKVDLTLTGEMLASLAIGSTHDGEIRIVILGDNNNAKAQGHVFGIPKRTGQARKVKIGTRTKTVYTTRKVRRRFVGLNEKEEAEVFEETLREEIGDRLLVIAIDGGLRVIDNK